jgi:hypothetical protein
LVFATPMGFMLTGIQQVLSKLEAADRAHQKEAAGGFLLMSVKYLCGFVVAVFTADVILHLPSKWRMALLVVFLGCMSVLGVAAWYIAVRRRNRLEHIARFLEGRDPSLGSRLINLLQLRDSCRDPELSPLTRELARQAVEGYSAELKGTPLERLARTGELRLQTKRALVALAIFAGVLAVFFRVTAVELARFADPFGDHPPYSLTRLEILSPGPAGTNVVYGKGLVVRVQVGGHRPKELFLTCFPPGHPEKAKTLPMFEKAGIGFDQLIEPVHTDLLVYAHTKDKAAMSRQARIGVLLTPRLEHAWLMISPPAYTRIGPSEKPYTFQNAQALAGSELRFRLQSNRPLREGQLEFAGASGVQSLDMTPIGPKEVSGTIIATESGQLRFALTDADGLPSEKVWEGVLTVTHDLPPEIQISTPERDSFVAVDFKLQAQIDASDDYGVEVMRIHTGLNGLYDRPRTFTNTPPAREQRQTVELDFQAMGYSPGDVVSLYAEAIDTAPDPHVARSSTVRLFVISVEDYNTFLREQTDMAEIAEKYEELMNTLQEFIEQQKELSARAEKLEQQIASSSPAQREKLAMQLDELLAKQSELNTRLEQHADQMDNFVRKDPVYDVERDLQEMLDKLAEKIRNSTGANTASNAKIAQRSRPEGPRQVSADLAEAFKAAADDQVARLEGVQEETDQQVAQTLRDLSLLQELLKDLNEFEALYRVQQELAAQAQVYNRVGQLSREDQLALKDMAGVEKDIGDRLDALARKLLQDAAAAEELFPKAARSGRDFAEKMEELRLSPLARQTTSQMLAGKGDRSYRMAERLREEMEKFFSDCSECRGEGSDELDSYLSLTRSMNPAQNFAQMARSRKFGSGKGRGFGFGFGEGTGASGSSGFATLNANSMSVMGNERSPSQGSATTRESSRQGRGTALKSSQISKLDLEKADVLKDLNPVDRQSAAVNSETGLDEYTELVDTYFKALTTRKKK